MIKWYWSNDPWSNGIEAALKSISLTKWPWEQGHQVYAQILAWILRIKNESLVLFAEMEATKERDEIIQFIQNSQRGIMKGYFKN